MLKKLSRKSKGEIVFEAVVYLILAIVFLIVLLPLLYVVATSFASAQELAENHFLLIPKHPTLEVYQYIFSTGTFARSLLVTVGITFAGTAFNLLMTCLMAYPLSRRALPGRRVLMTAVTITLVFSGGTIPMYLVVSGCGLIDSYFSLIIPGAISSFNLILVKNFFQEIPESLIESAQIDGSSEINTLIKIVLPLSKPALATLMDFGLNHKVESFEALEQCLREDLMEPLLAAADSQMKQQNIIYKIVEYLNENIDKDVSLEQCAREFNYNANYLSCLFKQKFGKTYTEYVVELKVEKCKELLVRTDISVNDLASRFGYSSSQNFIRVFKKYTLMTPGQYRKQHADEK